MNEEPSPTTEQLVAALSVAEADLDATGWGDESTRLYLVVSDEDAPWLRLFAQFDQHPVAAVDFLLEGGHGLGGHDDIVGVVALSEAWRHLNGPELKAAIGDDTADLPMPPETDEDWELLAATMSKRTRPRELPDHLRAEVRVAACVLRDDRLVQILRDRGNNSTSVSNPQRVSTLAEDVYIPHALAKLLSTPGAEAN